MAIKEEKMMKKLASLLLVLGLLLTSVAFAEEITSTITLSVLDEDGNAFIGADVTVYNAANNAVEVFVSGNEPYVIEDLKEGMYTARATDPADGYTAVASFYADADQDVELVIRKLQVGAKATVGTLTKPSGSFFTEMWGNNTTDIDVRALVHGLSTVSWTMDRQYGIDPTVVKDVRIDQSTHGDRTYTFTLNDDLTYSDGTPITAADYVFSVLLQSADEIEALGAQTQTYAQINGHHDFSTGETEAFNGVHLLGKYRFSLTLNRRYLPYFYELMYVNVIPYPISVIAPNCEVRDSGDGAYIAAIEETDGAFTTEVLEKTILDPENGYLSHPSVSSGPYVLTAYDPQAGTAAFRVNEYYKGNYQGIKPVIENLELRTVKYSEALELLASGELDVVNKATEGDFIDAGVQRFGAGEFNATNYLRTGYGFLAFACEQDVTSSVAVRQAMAMAFDRSQMIEEFLKSYGMEVYSYYGLGQWMVSPYASTMNEQVTMYPNDVNAAEALLIEDGWTLNAQGGEFEAGEGAVRYKMDENGELMPLEIRFAQVQDNEAAAWVVENYAPVLRELGFDFIVTEMAFDEMLSQYYRQTERSFNLTYLATNFAIVFDPYYTFNTDPAYQGALNTSGIADEKLMELAKELRETKPGDEEAYAEKWLELMKHYSDVLPTLPIYSNVYFDFFANDLMEYAPNAHWAWPSAILYAYIAE